MTGAFGFEPTSHERAVVELEDGSRLVYRDVRRFGTWLVVSDEELEPYLGAKNGPEPLGPAFTTSWLAARLAVRRAPLKAVLLDQRVVAGLGNIYADEALWRARLNPLRPANTLDAGRGDAATAGDPSRAACRNRAPGLDASGLRQARRIGGHDAGGVPGVRPRRRAVPEMPCADREDARRRSRHLVLPGLPTGAPRSPSAPRPRRPSRPRQSRTTQAGDAALSRRAQRRRSSRPRRSPQQPGRARLPRSVNTPSQSPVAVRELDDRRSESRPTQPTFCSV